METPKPMVLKLRHTGSPSKAGGVGAIWETDVSYTLSTTQDQTLFAPEEDEYVVRRLTPRECERLQGFPDDWTKIPWKGRPAEECPDGVRYKAIGNSMTTNVMRWIGERVEMVDALLFSEEEQ